MKKSICVLLGATLILTSCCLTACSGSDTEISKKEQNAFIEEIGGCSETYVGALSEGTYETGDEAAGAYVLEEVASSFNCIVESVVSEGEASDEDIQQVGIPDELLDGAKTVEKYTVTYSEDVQLSNSNRNGQRVVNCAETDRRENATVLVYVIGGEDWFKYFAPVVETGETVTSSYYNSIFHSEQFNNCTVVSTTTAEIKVKVLLFTVTTHMTATSTCKYADNCVYIEQKIEYDTDQIEGSETKIYAELNDDGSVERCYVYEYGEWMTGYWVDEGALKPFGDQFLHYSYFTKTDYGCTLEKENLTAYISRSLKNMDIASDDLEVDGSVNYYVTEGRLNGIYSKMVVDMTVDTSEASAFQSSKITENITTTVKCIDYGKTVIENPVG